MGRRSRSRCMSRKEETALDENSQDQGTTAPEECGRRSDKKRSLITASSQIEPSSDSLEPHDDLTKDQAVPQASPQPKSTPKSKKKPWDAFARYKTDIDHSTPDYGLLRHVKMNPTDEPPQKSVFNKALDTVSDTVGHAMGKLRNLGGFRALNTLDGPSDHRKATSSPVAAQPIPRSENPPPHKRRRMDDAVSPTSGIHTTSTFVLDNSMEGSAGPYSAQGSHHQPIEVADSQSAKDVPSSRGPSIKASAKTEKGIPEFKSTQDYVSTTSKRGRHSGARKTGAPSLHQFKAPQRQAPGAIEAIEDSGDDLDQYHPNNLSQGQQAHSTTHNPNLEKSSHFPGNANHSHGSTVKSGAQKAAPLHSQPAKQLLKAGNKRPLPDNDIDELSRDSSSPPAKRIVQSTKGATQMAKAGSSSISRRGDLLPGRASIIQEIKDAVGEGILVLQALAEPGHMYPRQAWWNGSEDVPAFEATDSCTLKLPDQGHDLLLPFTRTDLPNEAYPWLRVDLLKLRQVECNPHSSFASILMSTYIGEEYTVGPRIMLRFQGSEDTQAFITWINLARKFPGNALTFPISIDASSQKLEKQFKKLSQVLVGHEEVKAKLNAKRQEVGAREQRARLDDSDILSADQATTHTEPQMRVSQQKFRERMNVAGTEADAGNGNISSRSTVRTRHGQPFDEPLMSLAAGGRTTRTRTTVATRSTKPASPTPPPGWSSVNKGWKKDWKVDLNYHRTRVVKDDIHRLDEGEFLNDSLIAFYLKYLENTMPESLSKRVFFHNSYFYERLKVPGKKINYDGVKKWTAKVDIFSYDYIVVPVNERYHWWVAIICNVPKLLPSQSPVEAVDLEAGEAAASTPVPHEVSLIIEDDKQESEASAPRDDQAGAVTPKTPVEPNKSARVPPQSSSPRTDGVTSDMSAMSLDGYGECGHGGASNKNTANAKSATTPINVDDEEDVTVVTSDLAHTATPKPKKQGKKSPGPPPRKYDPTEPRIITLDSMDAAHSVAVGNLKQYLVAEAKEKKQIDIDEPKNFGMTAKQIPQQENFSDCGLYLLGYIKEFVQNPDVFVRKIQQREAPKWSINAPKMRNELRDLIFKLQKKGQEDDELEEKKRRKAKKEAKQSKTAAQSSPLVASSANPATQADPSTTTSRQPTPGTAPASAKTSRQATPTVYDVGVAGKTIPTTPATRAKQTPSGKQQAQVDLTSPAQPAEHSNEAVAVD